MYLSKSIQTQLWAGRIEREMHSKLLLKKLHVKNRSVWHSVECVVSRRRHKEGRIEYRDSTLISDHWGDYIGTMSIETQGGKAWKEEKLSKLQRLKAKKVCEVNWDLK